MNPPVWVVELAGQFWAAAGPPPPFPRDLAGPAMVGLPLRVVMLPNLRLDAVRVWLARVRVPCLTDEPDRPLRACLVARAGVGFVFADAADPPDERRFSVAHEVAHFLRDCDAVRRTATRLGPAALEVLDGERSATAEERVQAVFRQVPLAAHVHLLRRDDTGRPLSDAERDAEDAADRLAFELLAPAEAVRQAGVPAPSLQERLVSEFGLPPGPAAVYAAMLCPPAPLTDAFVERLTKSR